MADVKRIDVGFDGGQVLTLRMTEEEYRRLRDALSNEDSPRIHELRTQDAEVVVDLSEIVYVRLDTELHKVGF